MLESIIKTFSKKEKNHPNQKVLLTLFVIFLYRFGNAIPLSGIDQDALKQSFGQLDNRNAIMQIINMYSGAGGNTLLSPFSLGIIPFINASILIDLLTALFPSLEKLQSEEGEIGRRKLLLYKKLVSLVFAIGQSALLIFYLKSYFYSSTFVTFFLTGLQLVTGSMIIVWLSNIVDNKGVGNGTSIIIFTNILVGLITKNFINFEDINSGFISEILVILFLILLISISQLSALTIQVVSARQLTFLNAQNDKNNSLATESADEDDNSFLGQIKNNGLIIKLNQAGIFPIIIASNLVPFLSYFMQILPQGFNISYINNLIYYLLIIGFNYFYTIVFWDPDKIAEQLRKSSVSLVNITPGKDTAIHLEKIVRVTSLLGGLFLCIILVLYDFIKQIINGPLLNQLNISSLIILVGVAYDLQRVIRGLYKNLVFT